VTLDGVNAVWYARRTPKPAGWFSNVHGGAFMWGDSCGAGLVLSVLVELKRLNIAMPGCALRRTPS